MTYVILDRSLFTGSVSVLVNPLRVLRETGTGRSILKAFVPATEPCGGVLDRYGLLGSSQKTLLHLGKILGPVIVAPIVQRTLRTMKPDRPADKLAELYEDLVQRQPIFPVSKAGQFLLSLLRRLCLNHPNSVENPMNVGIDGNRG